ncbi:MAG TPA: hypothetical protein VFP15_13945 [Gemmatimonadaceae bacterium]|nr:hypothetical protein [Gemmatimonadaceae bacterium]
MAREVRARSGADACYQEWRDRVDIKRAAKDEPWGARTFDLLDPFANSIFVMGPPRT